MRAPTLCAAALLAGLLSACGGGPSASLNVTVTAPAGWSQEQALSQFDSLWSTFDRDYAHFEDKQIDWDALRSEFRPQAAASKSQPELQAVLLQMLGRLHDLHVHFDGPNGSQLASYTNPRAANVDLNLLANWFKGQQGVLLRDELGYARVPGGAYVGIRSWRNGAFSVADIDQLFEQLRDSPALIIDVRMNGGGDDSLAAAFGARLLEQSRVMHYTKTRNGARHSDFTPLEARIVEPRGPWTYRGKLIVLTGAASASSTESFLSLLHGLPNVILLGERSAGASGNPASYRLNADWSYTVPRWVAYAGDTQPIEDRGILPDVTVVAAAADFAAGRDPVLEAALARLK
ncbi:S41 family peptidase [Massilia sp. TS11]|uniref:S41 family peptidase n=1 Tax=Massilia sp. TS11 TaxID=2908003 RepID=UPI001EDB139B|nr:S41 family peptidase [Massilia sp. TS11]MCG2584999.1 S41 family peptidase [Massilia sp. TS11]